MLFIVDSVFVYSWCSMIHSQSIRASLCRPFKCNKATHAGRVCLLCFVLLMQTIAMATL